MSDQATTIPDLEGHSPLPWQVDRWPAGDTIQVKATTGGVATIQARRRLSKRNQLDATLIVAAVNAFPLLDEMGKALEQMPCWSPYEGSYFSGCDHRVPPEMRHATDSEECRRCSALSRYHELRGQPHKCASVREAEEKECEMCLTQIPWGEGRVGDPQYEASDERR